MEPYLYREMAQLEDSHWWFQARRRVIQAVLERHLPLKPLRILDVGCGTGGMLRMLSSFGTVEGLDASSEALAFCRTRVGSDIVLHQGQLPEGLPAAPPFDVITAFDVIEHLEHPVEALQALRGALSAEGVLVCSVPAFPFLWSAHDVSHHHHRRYTRLVLQQQLKAAGFGSVWSSYFNTVLFGPIAAARLFQRLRNKGHEGAQSSDLHPVAPGLNHLLKRLFSLERLVVPRLALPLGTSLLAVARLNERSG